MDIWTKTENHLAEYEKEYELTFELGYSVLSNWIADFKPPFDHLTAPHFPLCIGQDENRLKAIQIASGFLLEELTGIERKAAPRSFEEDTYIWRQVDDFLKKYRKPYWMCFQLDYSPSTGWLADFSPQKNHPQGTLDGLWKGQDKDRGKAILKALSLSEREMKNHLIRIEKGSV